MENEIESKISAKKIRAALVRYWWALPIAACLAAGASLLFFKSGPSSAQDRKGAAFTTSVTAAQARKADFNIYITALGSVTPLNTVSVKSRVDGQLMEVNFKEGQMVASGELLARIDPRPFEVQLMQAEGQTARDQELLANARIDLQRYKALWQQDSIPRQQLDTQEALVRQYEGTVKADKAQIESARLQLVYCRITAPIAGRVGLRQVDPGNIIHASDSTGLVVITQLQPIAVVFSIPEDSLPGVLARIKKGERPPVEAYDRELKQKLADGYLLTIDNQIDPTTGTVRLKAVFQNKANELFPNQFVNARLLSEVRKNATVVPTPAIQRGPQGAFVYVIKPEGTVEMRQVAVGEVQGGESAVKSGLEPGESVVTDGADRLRDGSRVEIRNRNADGKKKGR